MKTAVIVCALCAMCVVVASAQTGRVGINTTMPQAMLHVQDSSVLFRGPNTLPFTPGPPPVSGEGTRMMWYPDKAAFRAGSVSGTQWDQGNIGLFSFVGGGAQNTASGPSCFVGGGTYNIASETYSFVGGGAQNTVSGGYSFVGGGYQNTASGVFDSFVGGGSHNIASGASSFVGGGTQLRARSFSEAVFGTHNTDYTPTSTDFFISTDRLFVIGNGTNTNSRSNAVTVLKNGRVGIGVDVPERTLHVRMGDSSGGLLNGNAVAVLERNANAFLNIITPNANSSGVLFGNASSSAHGGILYNDPDAISGLAFRTNGNVTRMVLTNAGRVGIGNTTPERTLHVSSGSSGASSNTAAVAVFERSGSAVINLLTPNANFSGILFGNVAHDGHGSIVYNNAIVSNGLAFQTNGGTTRMVVTSTGSVGIGTTTPGFLLEVNGDAAKPGGGSWSSTSDARLKQHVHPFTHGLQAILAIRPVAFQYNTLSGYNTDDVHIGVIAQELQQIAPYMVSTSDKVLADGTSGYLHVDNSAMTYLLINAVKELADRLGGQQEMITALQRQNAQLLDRIVALEQNAHSRNP